MKNERKIVLISVALAAALWLLDAVLDTINYNEPFLSVLIFDKKEVFFRLLLTASLISFGFFMDRAVQRRRRTEDDLRLAKQSAEEERAKAEAVVSAMGDGVSIQGRDYKVLYQNEAHKKLSGGDCSGQLCYAAFAKRDGVCPGCPVEMAFKDGRVHRLEKSGENERGQFYVDISASPLRDASGEVVAAIEVVRDITYRKLMEKEKEELIYELREAFDNIKTLKGLLPICAWCKKIRDDKGYWKKVEEYLEEHAEVMFTHGICPQCFEEHSPEIYKTLPEEEKGG